MEELEIIRDIYGANLKHSEYESGYLLEFLDNDLCIKIIISEQFPANILHSLKFVIKGEHIKIYQKNILMEKLQCFLVENEENLDGILFRTIEYIRECSAGFVEQLSSDSNTISDCISGSKCQNDIDSNLVGPGNAAIIADVEQRIIHGPFVTVKKSVFQAHCYSLRDVSEVDVFRYIVLQDRKVQTSSF